MSEEKRKTAIQQALEQPVFGERVASAAAILGIGEDVLARILVEDLGADTSPRLGRVTFQDIMERVSGSLPVRVREALDILKGDEKGDGKGRAEGGTGDLVKELRDETRLHELTGGRPLLCEQGGHEHSAANIRHYRKTGQAPKVCVFAGCGKVLASPRAEVSFEDGVTFLAPDGTNPQTGRNEGRFSLANRSLARIFIERGYLTVDEAWRRLEDGSLRAHFSIPAAEVEETDPGYANRLRKPFGGVRTGSGTDPYYRDRQSGHTRY